eukprot:3208956-Amphidinium_carterae.1
MRGSNPVDVQLLVAWCEQARDPDAHVISWLEHGAPLGMECPIPESPIISKCTGRRSCGSLLAVRTGVD